MIRELVKRSSKIFEFYEKIYSKKLDAEVIVMVCVFEN